MESERDPKCILCHKVRTADAYELDATELASLVERFKLWRAPRVHERFGAIPLCPSCLAKTGLTVEGAPTDGAPSLVRIKRRDGS